MEREVTKAALPCPRHMPTRPGQDNRRCHTMERAGAPAPLVYLEGAKAFGPETTLSFLYYYNATLSYRKIILEE